MSGGGVDENYYMNTDALRTAHCVYDECVCMCFWRLNCRFCRCTFRYMMCVYHVLIVFGTHSRA